MKYLKDGTFYFIKIIEYDNLDFIYKMIKDKICKKDSKKMDTNLEEEVSKKKYNIKRKKI